MAPRRRPAPALKRRHTSETTRLIKVHPPARKPSPLFGSIGDSPRPGHAHPYTAYSANPALVRHVLNYDAQGVGYETPWVDRIDSPYPSPVTPHFDHKDIPPSPLRAWLNTAPRYRSESPPPGPKGQRVIVVAAPREPEPLTIAPALLKLNSPTNPAPVHPVGSVFATPGYSPLCAETLLPSLVNMSVSQTPPTPAASSVGQRPLATPAGIAKPALTPTITPMFTSPGTPATPRTPGSAAHHAHSLFRVPLKPSRKCRPPPLDIGARLASAGVPVENIDDAVSDTEMEMEAESESDDEEHELRTLYAYMNPKRYGRVDLADPLCSPMDF